MNMVSYRKQSNKIKVAIGHVRIGWGGSEKRVFWGIDALKNDYDVTLITAGEFDLDKSNNYYGTKLKSYDFKIRQAPIPFFLRKNSKAAALRGAFYQRFCRNIAYDYDVLISAYGVCDFGVPAIHFLADFTWDEEIRSNFHPHPPGVVYRKHFLRSLYLFLSKLISNPSGRNLFAGEDEIVSVSNWMAEIIYQKYRLKTKVLNSPVPGHFPDKLFHEKENGFVCMGRIAPEKRIEECIEILKCVRNKGHNIHLHLVGGIENKSYGDYIQKLVYENKSWIFFEGKLYGKEKSEMLANHKYGIHACRGDAFPGAVAEMIKSGCIPFVPDQGGQVEIISTPLLIYKSLPEAMNIIDSVLKSEQLQYQLTCYFYRKKNFYSVNDFQGSFKKIIDDFITKNSLSELKTVY
jgi:glycosyltransferase involved in cell wall biosynthesis